MRFKTDENIPEEVVDILRGAGHDVLSVYSQGFAGFVDPAVAAVCKVEKRAIVTNDLDFSDVRRYPPEHYSGIIVLRPFVQNTPVLERLISRVIALLPLQPLEGCLWIVDDHRVRIRDALGTDEH